METIYFFEATSLTRWRRFIWSFILDPVHYLAEIVIRAKGNIILFAFNLLKLISS